MKIHRFSHRNAAARQRGFSLVELSLVITGAMVLIGIGLAVYRNVQSASGALSDQNGLIQLTGGIKTLYPLQDYTGLSSAVLIGSGNVPDSMLSSSGVLINSFGGSVSATAANYAGGTANAYSITYANVPREPCNKLVAAVQSQFNKITIGSRTVAKDDSATPQIVYDVGSTVDMCNNARNTITFIGT